MDGTFSFRLNGRDVSVDASPMRRLLDLLREELRLAGTKEGCGEGECGSCTVLLDGEPVCSCLVPVMQVAGREVVTIEGLEGPGAGLDPLQQAFVEAGGVQCGACTPGLLMTSRALLDSAGTPDRSAVREALAGNLCRCTGYERIFRAIETVAGGSAAGDAGDPAAVGGSAPRGRGAGRVAPSGRGAGRVAPSGRQNPPERDDR